MDIDNENGVMDFIAEVAELDDPDPEEDDGCKFPGFQRIEVRSENKDDEDEDGPLYNMDVLTSEADDLMSSAFKPYHYPEQSEEDIEEDIEETPITRKIQKRKIVGGKGKGKMREVKGDKKRKTKGILLREMITRASRDHVDGGNAVSGPSRVNSGSVPGTL